MSEGNKQQNTTQQQNGVQMQQDQQQQQQSQVQQPQAQQQSQQQAQQNQQQNTAGQQVMVNNHDGSQQGGQLQANQGQSAAPVTPQALIINTANIAQQQQTQQLQNVAALQQNAASQQQQQQSQQQQLQPAQSPMSMQTSLGSMSVQSGANTITTMQAPLGSIPIQQSGQTTITTMQAPPGSLPQSVANTITTMQAPLGTMALQGGGQQIGTMQASTAGLPIQTAQSGGVPLQPAQSGTTTITTMSNLHQQHPMQPQTPQPQQGQIQQISEWGHGRVQVIQQPIQNPTYLQQLYNTQGQLLMPGNIALHPAGMNPGSIQVIAAGKTFQPNQLAAPHMLTTAQGKQVIAQGQAASFPSYATIPTTTNQTLVISQLGVISSQPNILPAHSATNNKQDVQKYNLQYTTCQGNRNVQQNTQPMQFSPWQFGASLPQGIAWATPQPPALLTTQNPIFIRGTTQTEGTAPPPMFIQSPPPQTIHTQHPQGITTQSTIPNLTQIAVSGGGNAAVVNTKPARTVAENIQPKSSTTTARPLSNILPSVPGQQAIRPASSVSTQTGVAQHLTQAQLQNQKAQAKMRPKSVMARQIGLGAGQKADAANQTKPQSISPQQQLAANNKMIITSVGALQISADKLQQQQLQQQKVVQQQIVAATMQQQINLQQQQQQQQQQVQQQVQQQHTQPQQQLGFQQPQQQMLQPKPPPLIGVPLISLQQPPQQSSPQPQAHQLQQLAQAQPQPQQPQQQQQMPTQQQPTQPQQIQIQISGTATAPQPPTQQTTLVDRPVMPVVSMPPLPPCPTPIPPQAGNASPANNLPLIVPPPVQPISPQISSQVGMVPGVVKEETSNSAPEDKVSTGSNILSAETPTVPKSEAPQLPLENGTGTECLNGDIAASSEEVVKDRGPPKAMVKPHQVLTHVIEGYVIQEASEPFPVSRSSLLTELAQSARTEKENRQNVMLDADEPPLKKQNIDSSTVPKRDVGKCEFCGKVDLRSRMKKSKRFCSVGCAKRASVAGNKRVSGGSPGAVYKMNSGTPATNGDSGVVSDDKSIKTDKSWPKPNTEWSGVDQQSTDMDTNDSAASGPESSLSPSEAPDATGGMDTEDGSTSDSPNSSAPKVNPLKWSVSDVCEFIRALPGCCDYAEDFAIQEIDGQALMLLKEDHLMSAMAMKLGPALKICAKIDTMRGDSGNKPPQQQSPEK